MAGLRVARGRYRRSRSFSDPPGLRRGETDRRKADSDPRPDHQGERGLFHGKQPGISRNGPEPRAAGGGLGRADRMKPSIEIEPKVNPQINPQINPMTKKRE